MFHTSPGREKGWRKGKNKKKRGKKKKGKKRGGKNLIKLYITFKKKKKVSDRPKTCNQTYEFPKKYRPPQSITQHNPQNYTKLRIIKIQDTTQNLRFMHLLRQLFPHQ
jgi:hypothetical protein